MIDGRYTLDEAAAHIYGPPADRDERRHRQDVLRGAIRNGRLRATKGRLAHRAVWLVAPDDLEDYARWRHGATGRPVAAAPAPAGAPPERPERWRAAGGRAVGRASVAPPGALFASWVRVYEALEPLACARCRRPIRVGALFTRRRGMQAEGGRGPVCRPCAPFPDPELA